MPTAEEFDQAASLLDDVGDATEVLVTPVAAAMGPDVMSGGRWTETVEQFISRQLDDSRAIAGEFHQLASECRNRAETVREAAREHAEYEALQATQEELLSRREAGEELSFFENAIADADLTPPDPPPPWAEF